MTSCMYDGKEYSEGSLLCKNNRELKCSAGEWRETGYSCSTTGNNKALDDVPIIDSDDPRINDTEAKHRKPIIVMQYTVYAEVFSIRKDLDYVYFSAAPTIGTVCNDQGMQNYAVPIQDIISIGNEERCSNNPVRHYKRIVFAGA